MKQLFVILLLLIGSLTSRAQFYNNEVWSKEIGLSLNAMNCNTDVEGQIVDFHSFRPGIGLYAGALYRQRIGARLEIGIGSVTASDAKGHAYKYRSRNLDFTSTIIEVSLLGELHPLNFLMKDDKMPALSPYLMAGVGYFHFNPRTKYNGGWVDLQPLHTEGQGFPETGRPNYKLSALNIPVGGGLQYNVSDRVVLRGEAVYRVLNTDYLDDVSTTYIDPNLFDKYLSFDNAILAKRLSDRSYQIAENGVRPPGSQRGGAKNDAYYSINLKVGIRLGSDYGARTGPFINKQHGCCRF